MSDSEMTSDDILLTLLKVDFRGPIVWRIRCAGGIRMIDLEIFLEMVNMGIQGHGFLVSHLNKIEGFTLHVSLPLILCSQAGKPDISAQSH